MDAPLPAIAGLPMALCAWCRGLIRDGCTPVSHGICPSCAEGLKAEDLKAEDAESTENRPEKGSK